MKTEIIFNKTVTFDDKYQIILFHLTFSINQAELWVGILWDWRDWMLDACSLYATVHGVTTCLHHPHEDWQHASWPHDLQPYSAHPTAEHTRSVTWRSPVRGHPCHWLHQELAASR